MLKFVGMILKVIVVGVILKTLKNSKLPICVSKGYLLNQSNGITKIFTDYIESKEKPTFDNIGNTTLFQLQLL